MWTAESVMEQMMSPAYAGCGPYPAIIDVKMWVDAQAAMIDRKEITVEKYLSQMLRVCRVLFGQWGISHENDDCKIITDHKTSPGYEPTLPKIDVSSGAESARKTVLEAEMTSDTLNQVLALAVSVVSLGICGLSQPVAKDSKWVEANANLINQKGVRWWAIEFIHSLRHLASHPRRDESVSIKPGEVN